MDNLKALDLIRQTRIRNKVEKKNRSEVWVLKRKLNVIDKEKEHFNAMLIKQKRDIILKLKEIQRCSGHSIMSLPVGSHDNYIKSSTLFKTGIIVSEKQFQNWRLIEKSIQTKYRIKELEELQQLNRQNSLIQMLKDLNIITDRPEVNNESNEKQQDEKDKENENEKMKFPLIFEKIIKKIPFSKEISRPATVDCNHVQKEYIKSTTMGTVPTNFNKKIIDSVIYEDFYKSPVILISRSQSAKVPKELSQKKEQTFINQPSIKKSLGKHLISEKPKHIMRPKSKPDEKVSKPNEENNLPLVMPGFSSLPRWKRQLLMETPIGLTESIYKDKVRITVSQAQKRRDLENLVENNTIDIEKLAKEKALEIKRKVENMQETLREMDKLEQENKETTFTSMKPNI